MAKGKPKKKAPALLPGWLSDCRRMGWLVFAFGALLYANTLGHDFALDDAIVIYDNEYTRQGLAGVDELLRYDTFRGFFKVEGKEKLVTGGRYRPLTPILFALEVELFGLKPWPGHLGNVLLYGLTCLLIYFLLWDLCHLHPRLKQGAPLVAAAAALLFAAHPIHTEVVANIKGRDEIMALLGSVAAFWLSLKGYRSGRPLYAFWAGLVFFLALLSKENAITWLAVVPLGYWVFTRAEPGRILRLSLPFVAAAVVFLLIRGSVLGWSLGEPSRELMNNPFLKLVDGRYVDFSPAEKYATIFYTLGEYLRLLLFPHPLTHDYYPRHIPIMSFADWRVLGSLAVYLFLGIWALLRLPRKDPLSFAVLYYLATLSIVSNIVFPIGTNMGERFAFMPSLGFCFAAAVLLWRWLQSDPRPRLRPAFAILGVVLLLFSARTLTRNPVWKDNLTLFTTDLRTAPNSAKLRNAVGGELITQAVKPENEARREAMLRQAVEHLQEAVRIHPAFKNAYLLLGNAHNYLQEYDKAIEFYQHALRLDPEYPEARHNLAVTYRDAGRHYGEQRNDLSRSLQYLQKAYELLPDDYETLRLLGVANGLAGRPERAVEFFRRAAEKEPQNADAWFNLAVACFNAGRQEEGLRYQQKALELDPNILEQRRQQR
ncbi:MAG: tetratricopeptide repeat protein [Bacteroidetes bacterium]|nr:MAG: tetratricopeptide repeat protein [Bacteroidota bacterium]